MSQEQSATDNNTEGQAGTYSSTQREGMKAPAQEPVDRDQALAGSAATEPADESGRPDPNAEDPGHTGVTPGDA